MNISRLIFDGLSTGFIFAFMVFVMIYHYPRYAIFQMPKSMTKGIEPTTAGEKKKCLILLSILYVFLLLFNGYDMAFVYKELDVSFLTLFYHGYLIGMFMNVFDIIFLDMMLIPIMKNTFFELGGNIEKFTNKNVFIKSTILEHFVSWPIIVCPIVGLITAGICELFMMM